MKKLLLIMLVVIFSLVGCTNDNEYLDTVKKITFDNGQTMEEIMTEMLTCGEIVIENPFIEKISESKIKSISMYSSKKFAKSFDNNPLLIPNINNIKWKIQGNTSNGKIILASTNDITAKIPTVKDGDYVEVNFNDIKLYDNKTNKLISEQNLIKALYLFITAQNNGYLVKTKEIQEKGKETFNPKTTFEFLKSTDGCVLEFYPSGRVKTISDGLFDLHFQDRANLQNIEESISWLEKNQQNDINIRSDVYHEAVYELIAEKSFKNNDENIQNKINALEKRLSKIGTKLHITNEYQLYNN